MVLQLLLRIVYNITKFRNRKVRQMRDTIKNQIVENAMQARTREDSIAYLAEHLGKFLRKQERVLICFDEHREGNLSWLMEQAVFRCGAIPVIWGPDHRWKTLLQQAFYSRASAIIGPPLVILGLTKLKKRNGTPLFIRRVVTAGYPCPDWMIDGIVKGLDCEAGGCFTLGETGVIAGFACGHSWGIHLRDNVYGVDIVGDDGECLPAGQAGEIVLYPKNAPQLRFSTGEFASLEMASCKCGSVSPRLMNFSAGKTMDPDLAELFQYLHSWTSILDCRLARGNSGLAIEIVCFPGEKLPRLPSAAKLLIRPWNPKNDEPFRYMPVFDARPDCGIEQSPYF